MTPLDRNVVKDYLDENTTEVKGSITTAKQEILAKVKEAADTGSSSGGVQTFTEDGTFTVPAGVTKILVTACAGGASCSWVSGASYAAGGQGGACIYKKAFQVTPGQEIPITVGKGGIFEAVTGGVAGNPTVVGNLVTLPGGAVSHLWVSAIKYKSRRWRYRWMGWRSICRFFWLGWTYWKRRAYTREFRENSWWRRRFIRRWCSSRL
jgi:hypothetical protein